MEQWLGQSNKLGIDIVNNKYRYNNESDQEWLDRVSGKDQELKNAIVKKKFLPGGRILSNRGIDSDIVKTTLSNCYVLPPPEDSLESIFLTAYELARTLSYGGGVGFDISKLSPSGAIIRNAAKTTSGITSFIELYSNITGTIGQGNRRGALMISLDCSHPEIENFIKLKTDLDKVTKANISIRITDDFMHAVKDNLPYKLYFHRPETDQTIEKIVNARDIFKMFAKVNWDYAEPGFLMWDTINEWNLLSKNDNFQYVGINPCGEEPLSAYSACLLGSINLSEFVVDPFSQSSKFDFLDFQNTVKIAVRSLNTILDEGIELHPLLEQQEESYYWRPIGCGLMGLADMLIKMGIAYGSPESIKLCDRIGCDMINYALQESALLAKKYGVYDGYNDSVLDTDFLKYNATEETVSLIKQYGLRNSQLLTIAPTGTLSTMLGISGGIEPIYANSYVRKTETLHNEDKYYKVFTGIAKNYMDDRGIIDESDLPSFFITSQDINYKNRINMQSVWQSHIDASISSTINLPNSATVKDVENLYMYAWERKLKGITVYRDGCKRAGILSTNQSKEKLKKDNLQSENGYDNVYNYLEPVSRKVIGTTHGSTYCKKCACGTLYITINKDEAGNIVETFLHTSKGGICGANTSAVCRLISLSMRSGILIDEIIDQLKGIKCDACMVCRKSGQEIDGLSCPDIIGRTIEDFYKINYQEPAPIKIEYKKIPQNIEEVIINMVECPECGIGLRHEEGCVTCINCGFSKCG